MKIIRKTPSLPLIVHTGKFTGRSPKDRYIVKTSKDIKHVEWGTRNRDISPEQFKEYEIIGKNLGFRHVESGPLVRSSYKAHKHIA